MKYIVTTTEEELRRYSYQVEANSPEGAQEKVNSGEVSYFENDLIDGEVVNVDIFTQEMTKEDELEAKLKIKVLWLAEWTAAEIAAFLALPLEFVESMVEVYKGK